MSSVVAVKVRMLLIKTNKENQMKKLLLIALLIIGCEESVRGITPTKKLLGEIK